jgi:hypothetical protein
VIRAPVGRDSATVGHLVDALGVYVSANDQAVIGWES